MKHNNNIQSENSGNDELKTLYIRIFKTAHASLNSKINKADIENVISQIVDEFFKGANNRLLLYSYSISEKNYIVAHIVNITILSIGFGVNLRLSREELIDIGIAAFCHDIGMAEYMHLFQKNSSLTSDENNMIKKHPLRSADMFRKYFPERIITAITDVHENVNGQGYPTGKTGIEISFPARIISICDVFEALTHQRNFRRKYNPYEAMKIIIKKKDSFFDKKIVKRFLDFMSIYPIGSLVHLNTGEVAMVIGSNSGYPTRSVVQILLTVKGEVDYSGKIINLLEDDMLYISGHVDPKGEQEIIHCLRPRGRIDL